MNQAEKDKLIIEGVEQLNQGVFPDSLLMRIRDKRLRDDIAKKIFNHSKPRFDSLSTDEKIIRRLRLQVILQFDSYVQSFLIFKNISYLLLIVGSLIWFSAFLGANDNGQYGFITTLTGFTFLLISYSDYLISKITIYLTILYSLLLTIEFIVLGFPDKLFGFLNHNPLSDRGSAIVISISELAPYVYVLIRLMIVYLLIRIYVTKNKYLKAKAGFENPTANKM